MAKVVDNRAKKTFRAPQVGDMIVYEDAKRIIVSDGSKYFLLNPLAFFITTSQYPTIDLLIRDCGDYKEIIPDDKIEIIIVD